MKVQTKILLLLAMVLTVFGGGLVALRNFERQNFQRIANERREVVVSSFKQYLERRGENLATLALEYSNLDDMVAALRDGNRGWIEANINETTLAMFEANAIWLYRADGTLANLKDNLYLAPEAGLPMDGKTSIPQLFQNDKKRHFFLRFSTGWLEVRGATIHPSRDVQRETLPQGYLFAGRYWSNQTFNELTALTDNKIEIIPATSGEPAIDTGRRDGGIVFSMPLPGLDGQSIAYIVAENQSPVLAGFTEASKRLMMWLTLFGALLLLVLAASLTLWVTQPLRRISDCLKHENAEVSQRFAGDRSEFGQLAQLIGNFFQQRTSLLQEIGERKVAEEALQKSEEQLRHSQKMDAVGRLAGGIAHDFNNLLTAIIGYSEILEERLQDSHLLQNAALIRKAGERAAELTRQLLAFSRKQLLQPKVLDLNLVIADVQKLLQRVIGEHFVIRTSPEASDGRVCADPGQLEQVIINLGVNARDAMPHGGTLTIRTANVEVDGSDATEAMNVPPGAYILLEVSDTGSGMDKETQSRIFEPFFTTKGPGKGTGLGLATVYGIVRQSGGGIRVISAPGEGSIFRIFLPKVDAPLEELRPALPLVEHTAHGETILVVEDEQIVRELVCSVLAAQGYEVLAASNGEDALRILRKHAAPVPLLITDVIMPGMNGHQLAHQLRKEMPEIKVLFVSGYSDKEIGAYGVSESEIEILQKPFTTQLLARRVRDLLAEDRAGE